MASQDGEVEINIDAGHLKIRKVIMTKASLGVFPKSLMASMLGLCLSPSVMALEALSDDHLSETVGAGIALLPQESYFVFRGAGPDEGKDVLFSDRSKDTGYFHFIPVGPLTKAAQDTNKDGVVDSRDHSVGKADLYLYGLALSRSDNDSNSRLANTEALAKIRSWGTASNPWIIKVATESNVPNFGPSNCQGANDSNCQVSYLSLEAPLYEAGVRDPVGEDAYKLKLAMWTDAFVLDQSKTATDANLYHLGEKPGTSDPNRANRIRLQAIWNNFSINGSRIQLFQSLGGANNSGGMSTFYNNTLGISALLRFNSGDANSLTAQSKSANILRISTREIGNSKNLETPAIHGIGAPVFDANEGLFIQNLNINLVAGSLFQPIILGSDGKNFSLEVARIPNKAEIYKKIYTNYDNPNPASNGGYYGSTCNVYVCGNNGSSLYQGNNATHSSITFGSTNYDKTKNLVTAYSGRDAVGISFGHPNPVNLPSNSPSINLGSGAVDGVLIQHLKITTKGL